MSNVVNTLLFLLEVVRFGIPLMSTFTLWSGSPQSKGFLTMPTTGPDTGWMLMIHSVDELSYLTAVKIKDSSES